MYPIDPPFKSSHRFLISFLNTQEFKYLISNIVHVQVVAGVGRLMQEWRKKVISCVGPYRAVAWGGRPRPGDPGREGGREGERGREGGRGGD